MDSEKTVDVSLTGAVNFTYKTTLQRAAQVIAFLSREDEEATVAPTFALTGAQAPSGSGREAGSPLEAIRQSDARTYPQKIAALGEFILRRNGGETFDGKEVLALLRRMGDLPRNYHRDVRNADLLGYISIEPNGEYFLTDLARQAIKSHFSDASSASGSPKKRRTKKKVEGGGEENH